MKKLVVTDVTLFSVYYESDAAVTSTCFEMLSPFSILLPRVFFESQQSIL